MKLPLKALMVIISISASIGVAELILYFEQRFVTVANLETSFHPAWDIDPEIGRIHPPNQNVSHLFKIDGKVIYDVVYTTDELGRRPIPKNQNQPERFVAVYGSSNVFGAGLNDDETWPYQLSLLLPNHQVYNYGIHSGSPQSLVGISRRILMNQEIQEQAGVFVYHFTYHHLKRLVGAFSTSGWTHQHLMLSLKDDGTLKNHGTFETARPKTQALFIWLRENTRLLSRLGIDFPRITDSTYELMTKLLLVTKENIESLSPDSKFLVLFNDTDNTENQRMMDELKKNGILHAVIKRPRIQGGYRHHKIYDKHENADGAKLLAKRFHETILKKVEGDE